MNIFDRLFSSLGYARKTPPIDSPPQHLLAHANVERFNIPDGTLYENQAELYQRLSWVAMAIDVISSSAAIVPFNVLQLSGEDRTDIPNHDFETLLRRPNPLMSRFEFLQATVAYRALTGNAYWWLNRASEDDTPTEIWIIPSHQIEPVPDERLYLRGYLYNPGDGTEIPLELHEVVHFKRFHPLNSFVGLSPIEALAVVAIGDMKMQDWNTRQFADNNARLPGILKFSDPIVDSEWERIKREVEENAARRNIMMMRNVGPGGVEWLQAAMSKREMEFLDGRRFNKEEIFNMFAPGLASMLDVNATEANAKAGRSTFSEYTLWPILVSIHEKVTNDILPSYSEDVIGEFDDIRYTDRSLELDEQREAGRYKTINEIRKEFYGADPLDDPRGDLLVEQIWTASSAFTVDKLGEDNTPPQLLQAGPPDDDVPEPSEPQDEAEPELEDEPSDGVKLLAKWERKVINRLRAGKDAWCTFQSSALPDAIRIGVQGMLRDAESHADVKSIFAIARNRMSEGGPDLLHLVNALEGATLAIKEQHGIAADRDDEISD